VEKKAKIIKVLALSVVIKVESGVI
jgi:hypothetical protein